MSDLVQAYLEGRKEKVSYWDTKYINGLKKSAIEGAFQAEINLLFSNLCIAFSGEEAPGDSFARFREGMKIAEVALRTALDDIGDEQE